MPPTEGQAELLGLQGRLLKMETDLEGSVRWPGGECEWRLSHWSLGHVVATGKSWEGFSTGSLCAGSRPAPPAPRLEEAPLPVQSYPPPSGTSPHTASETGPHRRPSPRPGPRVTLCGHEVTAAQHLGPVRPRRLGGWVPVPLQGPQHCTAAPWSTILMLMGTVQAVPSAWFQQPHPLPRP